MNADTSYLTGEKQVVNLLIQAADLLNPIYLRQVSADNPRMREEIAAKNDPALLDRFDTFMGPWDEVDEDKPFYGTAKRPVGGGFYPADLTKEQFDAYLAAHPAEADALRSPYTVVKRQGDKLVAVPYSQEYKQWLEPAAQAGESGGDHHQRQPQEIPDPARQGVPHRRLFRIRAGVDGLEGHADRVRDRPVRDLHRHAVRREDRVRSLCRRSAIPRNRRRSTSTRAICARWRPTFRSRRSTRTSSAGSNPRSPSATRSTPAATATTASRASPSTCPTTKGCARRRAPRRSSCSNMLGAKYDRILKPMAGLVLVPEDAANVNKRYMYMETLFHELATASGRDRSS